LDAVLPVLPVSMRVSMVVEGSTGTVECCLEHGCQTYAFFLPSPGRTPNVRLV
jgi:hypothetical protein